MEILNILKAVLFGIVEGVTEWLPVSSTGHMILLNEFVKLDVSEEFWKMFLVVIQFGAILAVILLFWKKIWPIGRRKSTGKLGWKKRTLVLWVKVLIACIPAGIVGVFLDDWIDEHFYNWFVVAVMLIVVGIAFIIVENRNKDLTPSVTDLSHISVKEAFIIGLFQVIAAVFPGTSRSGATILGGLMTGVSRKASSEFTFILAIPVMAGASLLKIVKFFSNGGSFSAGEGAVLIAGMVSAFLVSIFVIRFLMDFIRRHDFRPFGWYRIVLGAVVLLYFAVAGR